MKTLLPMIAFMISTQAAAFDYHGIREGMTRDDVKGVLQGAGLVKSVERMDDDLLKVASKERFGSASPQPEGVAFQYDHNDELFRVQVVYSKRDFTDAGFYDDATNARALADRFEASVTTQERSYVLELLDYDRERALLNEHTRQLMKSL